MTVAQIFTLSRFITNTNGTTASDANLLRSLSERQKQMVVRLANLLENYSLVKAGANLLASTENIDTLATDIIKFKRAEVQWTSGGTWYPVTFYDINESSETNDVTNINNINSTTSPFAFLNGTAVQMRPIPSVTSISGFQYWYVQMPGDLTSTSYSPSTPAEYHRLLADLVAIDIRLMKGELNPVTALQEEKLIWEYLKNQVSPRVSGQNLVAKPAYENYE